MHATCLLVPFIIERLVRVRGHCACGIGADFIALFEIRKCDLALVLYGIDVELVVVVVTSFLSGFVLLTARIVAQWWLCRVAVVVFVFGRVRLVVGIGIGGGGWRGRRGDRTSREALDDVWA